MRPAGSRLALLAVLAAGIWFGWRQYEEAWLAQPIEALRQAAIFDVPAGSSLTAVARLLERAGWLDRPSIWIRHAKRTGNAGLIRAGEYELRPGVTPAQLLDRFVAGDVLLHALTIPEGWTFRQALALMHAHPAVKSELADLPQQELMARLDLHDRHPEGLFFPDTYRFPRSTTDAELLRQAHARLERELDAAWIRRRPDLGLRSPYEALILASLVEKETGVAEERPLIAGVFINRLRRGMRLQTDPTVIYGLGAAFDGNLRRRDLEADTPYNTYTRAGLPPSPIALAGRSALEAAVRPAATDALFFVATGKGDGRHYFASTLAAHNLNVERHLANLRAASSDRVR